MSKRGPDTQRVGDTEEFSSTAPQVEGNNRATAAQLAARKIKAVKGTRHKHGRTSFIIDSPIKAPQEPKSSSFPPPNTTVSNGAHNPQAGFSFGQQPNGLSQSFNQPPSISTFSSTPNGSTNTFGTSGQNPFSAQFVPPSSGFSFNAAPNNVQNPFSSADPLGGPHAGGMTGYQGTIFNIPPFAPYGGSFLDSNVNPLIQDPAKTQAQGGTGIFGANASTGFGQSNTSSVQQNSAQGTTNIFGQPKPPTPLFKQSSSFSPNPISQQPSSTTFGLSDSQQSNQFSVQKEDIMATSPDTSPQPKGSGNSTPFGYPNIDRESSAKITPDGQGSADSLFNKISQPAADPVASAAGGQDSVQKDAQDRDLQNDLTSKAPFFGIPPAPAEAKARSPQASPTKKRNSKQIQEANLGPKAISDEAKAVSPNLFAGIKMPASLSDPPPPIQPSSTLFQLASTFTNAAHSTDGQSNFSTVKATSTLGDNMQGLDIETFDWYKPPTPPPEFTEEQRRQVIIGYQLKCLDGGVRQHLATNSQINHDSVTRFYLKCKQEIFDGKGFAVAQIAGRKRKTANSQHADESNSKRARVGASASNPPVQRHAANGSLSANNSAKQSFNQPASGAPVFAPTQQAKSLFNQPVSGAPVFAQTQQAKSLFTQPTPGASVPGPFQQGKSLLTQSAHAATPAQQAISVKRKALEDPDSNNADGAINGVKRPRAEDSISYPSLSSSTGSQTSSIFKNILGNKETESSPSAGEYNAPKSTLPVETPRFGGSAINSSTAVTGSQEQPPNIISESRSQTPSTRATGGPSAQLPPKSKPTFGFSQPLPSASISSKAFSNLPATSNNTFTNEVSQPVSSTSTSSNIFSNLSTKSTNTFLNKVSEQSSSTSKISTPFSNLSATSNNPLTNKVSHPPPSAAASSILFSSKSNTSNTASSATAKPPSIVPPKFGPPVNFLSQFGKAAEETAKKEKASRKAKDFDSDEDDEAEWERKDTEKQRAKKQKLEEAAAKATAPKFIPGVGFTVLDTKSEKKGSNPSQPLGSTPRSSVPSPSATLGASVFSKPRQKLENSQNIFGHLSDTESGADGSKTGDAESGPEGSKTGDADDEDEDTGSEDITEHGNREKEAKDKPASASSPQPENAVTRNPFGSSSTTPIKKPVERHQSDAVANNPFAATSALFTKKLAEQPDQSPTTRGLFDRITKDANGKPVREITSSNEKAKDPVKPTASPTTSNIFGTSSFSKSASSGLGGSVFGHSSSFSVSSTAQASSSTPKTNIFATISPAASSSSSSGVLGSSNSPSSDNTWKVDSPIKFASSDNPPQVKVSSPSPSKPALGALFGSPQSSSPTETSAKSTSGIFSTTPAKNPPVGFGFGFGGPPKSGTGSLAPPSDIASNVTSRATSPGATTGGESANDSNADGVDYETKKDAQLDLTARGPGEEDEDVVFTVKAKALVYDAENKSWPSKGVGMLRVLKHRDNSKTRILIRQDPSGKIVLNAALLSTLNYEYAASKTVKVAVATDTGKLSSWLIRTGKDEDARELAKILEAEKKN